MLIKIITITLWTKMAHSIKKLSIVVPTKGRAELVRKWVEHIKKLDYPRIEIVIIDNNSNNRLYHELTKSYPGLVVVKPRGNIGVTPSFYTGAAVSTGEILHFSNDDVFYEKDYFNRIVAELEKDRGIGIIGGTMLDKNNRIIQGPCVSNFELNFRIPGRMQKKFSDYRKIKGCFETAAIGGGQLTIRKQVLEECGNWDPDLFMYAEEVDLLMKVKKKGYKVMYVPRAVCYHLHIMQARDINKMMFYVCRNRLVVIRRHFKNPQRLFYLMSNLVSFFPRLILARAIKPRKWPEIKFILSGIKEGMRYFKTQKLEKVRIEIAKKRIPA